jgi:geranylgeranyl diphosphate synthase type I
MSATGIRWSVREGSLVCPTATPSWSVMATVLIMPTELAQLSTRVTASLASFMSEAAKTLAGVGPELAAASEATSQFVLAGGKRLRPAFCYWGWRGTGSPDSEELVNAAASLELLHACALIHDDVMDGSDTRRGRPSVHRRFAELHQSSGWTGSSDAFGASAAILLGDLCLVWADQMFTDCGLDAATVRRAAGVYAEMRVELMAGQYLDVLASVLPANAADATERALRVARFKSAKYTIERPLHLGAVLAGGTEELLAAYSAYGLPLGEAFQLRDDVLGVFGDPAVTGKPAGDDLREGKRTALVTIAEQRASPAEAQQLHQLLGNQELDATGVETCRDIIAGSGALSEVEQLIAVRGDQACRAIQSPLVDPAAQAALLALAAAATDRRG